MAGGDLDPARALRALDDVLGDLAGAVYHFERGGPLADVVLAMLRTARQTRSALAALGSATLRGYDERLVASFENEREHADEAMNIGDTGAAVEHTLLALGHLGQIVLPLAPEPVPDALLVAAREAVEMAGNGDTGWREHLRVALEVEDPITYARRLRREVGRAPSLEFGDEVTKPSESGSRGRVVEADPLGEWVHVRWPHATLREKVDDLRRVER